MDFLNICLISISKINNSLEFEKYAFYFINWQIFWVAIRSEQH